MTGRPTKCTPEVTEEICRRLSEGESLISICKSDHLPEKSTVLLWVVKGIQPFSDQYADARKANGQAHGDKIASVVHDVEQQQLDPQSAKVMIDGLKWIAERQAPKQYGNKQEIKHSGEMKFSNISEEELDRRLETLMNQAKSDS